MKAIIIKEPSGKTHGGLLDYAIVNQDMNQRVETGQEGMLLVRGPSVFEGYLNYQGDSPFVLFEGKSWYSTGDLVRENERDVLTFSGRKKRFIKLGGEMISLPAIESVLESIFVTADDEGRCWRLPQRLVSGRKSFFFRSKIWIVLK